MQVEITEQNIIVFGLVQLTGNTAEELLEAAAEASKNGYVLTCEVPENDEIKVNVFDVIGSKPVAEDEVEHQNPIMNENPYPSQTAPGRQVIVQGEVVETHIEEK